MVIFMHFGAFRALRARLLFLDILEANRLVLSYLRLVAGAGFEPAAFKVMRLAVLLGVLIFGNNLARKTGILRPNKFPRNRTF
jgi:hypothetical protein